MAKTGKQLKFEQAIGQVEAIIEQIESGEVGLEDSLAKYEQGMKLLGDCRRILDKAKKRIAELTLDGQGKPRRKADKSSEEAGDVDNQLEGDVDDSQRLL